MGKIATVAATLLLLIAPAALARVTLNTIDREGTVASDGERARVTVLLACDRVQEARVRVTLTQGPRQDEERAFGRGKRTVECTKDLGRFKVRVAARRDTSFDPGQATACALGLTNDDAIQWCREVRLKAR